MATTAEQLKLLFDMQKQMHGLIGTQKEMIELLHRRGDIQDQQIRILSDRLDTLEAKINEDG